MPDLTPRCGFVTLIGRPNTGKSTLLNQLVGQRLSITSPRPQTTRHALLGIRTYAEAQLIYIDTPGLHTRPAGHLGQMINGQAEQGLANADVIIWVLEAGRWHRDDAAVLARLQNFSGPVCAAVNKVDLVRPRIKLLPALAALGQRYNFSDIIPLSSKTGEQIKELEKTIINKLPKQTFIYPEDQLTDKSMRFLASEFIRAEILRATYAEIPHAVLIEIESFRETQQITHIETKIYVERPSQKSILIGAEGAMLKKIGTEARRKLEKLLGQKVNLTLWVTVKENWTEDPGTLNRLQNAQ